jgi:hypothetical protein
MTDDADEAAYLRREQARFRFFKRIEDAPQDSETPAGAPSAEPIAIAPSQNNSQANSPARQTASSVPVMVLAFRGPFVPFFPGIAEAVQRWV